VVEEKDEGEMNGVRLGVKRSFGFYYWGKQGDLRRKGLGSVVGKTEPI